ncbi:TetR/AcrR family transcriptional regulator [Microbacterium sp.]|uniref:TetR/AcrR family transcriptional regulator n=1 Tax=Microbacterium sp. TaxID=51671 RepID=UPI003C77B643
MTTTRSRAYRSAVRDEQAERTRRRIAQAARERFVESGWGGTSIRSVATAAGVSEATVFAVYGSKAGVALSLIDSADADADTARLIAEVEAAVGDPRRQLAAMIGFDRRLYERAGEVLRVIIEGGRTEPALAVAYAEGRARGNQGRRRFFASWPEGTLRRGMTVDDALDAYAIAVSIDVYDIALSERGWTADRLEQWWVTSLSEAILAPDAADHAARR